MPNCAISNCKSHSRVVNRVNGGITYHRNPIPSNPIAKEKWINATGKIDWFPSKYSTICSIHFKNDDFIVTEKCRRLCETAYPTILVLSTITNGENIDNQPTTNENATFFESRKKRKLSQDNSKPNWDESKDLKSMDKENNNRSIGKENIEPSTSNEKNQRYLQDKIREQKLKIKRLREQNRRKSKKIISLETIVDCLKSKSLVNEEQAELLKAMNATTKELFTRHIRNTKVVTTSKYSPALRSFALTLNYYSSKAYNYVRKTFNLSLPHPHTIQKWFKSVDGDPGFTTESLEALKLIVVKAKDPLYCCLVLDEMAIRRKIEWDGKKFHGYIDFGGCLDSDQVCEAKEALVFLVTCLNANWKVPVGYFLIDGATGAQKADLVLQCLRNLYEVKISVVGLTFDGCPSNLSMAKILGCKLETDNLISTFEHPVSKEPIAIFLDACHMVKLVRNCLQAYGNLVDKDGKSISWAHLEKLYTLQNTEYFNLANKLRQQHINFHNQKMKVKLATQLFSNSVAEALDFTREKLKISGFEESSATSEFIRIFNNLFDVLNSRNLKQFRYKKPLHSANKMEIMTFLNDAEDYIKGLKTSTGQFLIKSARKTGFLGFLVCIKSTRELFKHLIEEKRIHFMAMYRFSQDHLELFFCNVRAHGGSNNNPTSRQFKSFYKKLLCHIEIKSTDNGNCVALEQISILNCSSGVKTINATTSQITLAENLDGTELNMTSMRDFDEFCNKLPQMTNFSEQIITYIAGYVVRKLVKVIKCDECNRALLLQESRTEIFEFVMFKDKGGLVYPSKDAIQVCKVSEIVIREIIIKSQNFNTNPSLTKCHIVNKVLRSFINSNIFNSIAIHQFDQPPTENHLINLIKAIADVYIDVRLHYLTKYLKSATTKRQIYNKLVLFQGQ